MSGRDDTHRDNRSGVGRKRPAGKSISVRFSSRELGDFIIAWVALGVAFTLFFLRGGPGLVAAIGAGEFGTVVTAFGISILTAGVGFLVHELAHKFVAVRYGQLAEFRADYGMLFLAVVAATIGILFAAPGAVHHQGRITQRENGIIALAGPIVNLILAGVFVPLWLAGGVLGSGLIALLGLRGMAVNLFLAAFNLIPIGALDGATVREWNTLVWVAVFVPSALAAFVVVFLLGGL